MQISKKTIQLPKSIYLPNLLSSSGPDETIGGKNQIEITYPLQPEINLHEIYKHKKHNQQNIIYWHRMDIYTQGLRNHRNKFSKSRSMTLQGQQFYISCICGIFVCKQ